jgi:hypothetical protein
MLISPQLTALSAYRLIVRDKQRIKLLLPDFLQFEQTNSTKAAAGRENVAGVDETDSVGQEEVAPLSKEEKQQRTKQKPKQKGRKKLKRRIRFSPLCLIRHLIAERARKPLGTGKRLAMNFVSYVSFFTYFVSIFASPFPSSFSNPLFFANNTYPSSTCE